LGGAVYSKKKVFEKDVLGLWDRPVFGRKQKGVSEEATPRVSRSEKLKTGPASENGPIPLRKKQEIWEIPLKGVTAGCQPPSP